jgi:hypothetical protein
MAKRSGRRGRYRLLTPTERALIEARFRAGVRVGDVMAEFGVPHTSACRIQNEVAPTSLDLMLAVSIGRTRLRHRPRECAIPMTTILSH